MLNYNSTKSELEHIRNSPALEALSSNLGRVHGHHAGIILKAALTIFRIVGASSPATTQRAAAKMPLSSNGLEAEQTVWYLKVVRRKRRPQNRRSRYSSPGGETVSSWRTLRDMWGRKDLNALVVKVVIA